MTLIFHEQFYSNFTQIQLVILQIKFEDTVAPKTKTKLINMKSFLLSREKYDIVVITSLTVIWHTYWLYDGWTDRPTLKTYIFHPNHIRIFNKRSSCVYVFFKSRQYSLTNCKCEFFMIKRRQVKRFFTFFLYLFFLKR